MPPAPMLVPSEGVLRVLRHIAFASSAGAAVVVETRRRRIRAIEELHDNAKKIRSSRKYHAAAAGIEGKVQARWNDEGGPIEPGWNEVILTRRKAVVSTKAHSRDTKANVSSGKPIRAVSTTVPPCGRSQPEVSSIVRTCEQASTSIVTSQYALSYRIDALLAMGNIVGTMGKFFRYFYRCGGVDPTLLETARRISAVCKETSNLKLAHKFHRKLAGLGLAAQVHRESGGFDELIKNVEKLLEVCKVKRAATTFMDGTRGCGRVHIGRKAAEVIGSLFQATLHKKLWNMTIMLFWRLDYLGYEDPQAWVRLLQAHSERGEYKRVIAMYQRFRNRLELDQVGLAVVLRALIAQLRLSEAETLLRSALKPPWLPLGSCFTIILGGVWRVTKDLGRTMELFEWIKTWFYRYRPTASLFNAMIQACAEAGRMDRVEFYAQLMKEHCLEPNFKTHAHFLLAKAKNGHWKDVEIGLQKICEDGIRITQGDASAFNPLLVESSRTRPMGETESFLLSAVEKYGVVPDLDTFNIMSNVFIRAGELTSFTRLMDFMKKLGLQPDAVTFNTAFHGLWRDTKLHHMEMYRIFAKVQQHDKLLVNERTRNTIRSAIAHDSRKGSSRIARSPVRTIIERDSSAYQEQDARSIHVDMICALSQQDKRKAEVEVLQLYNKAKTSGVQISRGMVETAFQASILRSGGFRAGIALVQSAHEAGVNCAGLLPLVLLETPNQISQLPDFLLQMYRERDDNGLEITHRVSVTAASRLVNSHRAHAAIDILTRVMRSEWGKQKPLDIAGMTVLLKAYATAKTLKGVKQVVSEVLSRRMRIDMPFIRALRSAVAQLESESKKVEEKSGLAPHHMRQWIRDCRDRKSKQREEDQKRAEAIVDIFTDRTITGEAEPAAGASPVSPKAAHAGGGPYGSAKVAQANTKKAHIPQSRKTHIKQHRACLEQSTTCLNTTAKNPKLPSKQEWARSLAEERGGELREVFAR